MASQPKPLVKIDKTCTSYFFLANDGKRWHTQLHIKPPDFSEFCVKLINTILMLLQNPSYAVPNPYEKMRRISRKEEIDGDTLRYIG